MPNVGEDYGAMEMFIRVKLATPFLGNSLVYLLKLNVCIFYDTVVSLLVILLPAEYIYCIYIYI